MSENGNKLPGGKLSKNDQLAKAPFTRESFSVMLAFASEMKRAQLVPEGMTEAELILIMQKGRELGLPPMTAIERLYPVHNRIALMSGAMVGLIQNSGKCKQWLPEWDVETDTWTITTQRHDLEGVYVETFSWDEAQEIEYYDGKAKAFKKLISKSCWQNYRKEMLRHRCESNCARAYYADIIGGLYTPEELGAEIDIINGEPRVVDLDIAEIEAQIKEEGPAEPSEEQSDEAAELIGQTKAAGERLGYSAQKVEADIRDKTDGSAEQLGCLLNEYDEQEAAGFDEEPVSEPGEVKPLFEEGDSA